MRSASPRLEEQHRVRAAGAGRDQSGRTKAGIDVFGGRDSAEAADAGTNEQTLSQRVRSANEGGSHEAAPWTENTGRLSERRGRVVVAVESPVGEKEVYGD